jgi:hypothetical protein
MGLDIRLPIGMMFTIIGAVLMLFGLLSEPDIYVKSLGYNVNLWWGALLVVFGLVFLYYGSRATRRQP